MWWNLKCKSTADLRAESKEPRFTTLTVQEEAIVVVFWRHMLLTLDDCLDALQATIPHLARPSLYRCLQRCGINRLSDVDADKPVRARFKPYLIGLFHVYLAEVRTEQGGLHLLVEIDRSLELDSTKLYEKATRRIAGDFLRPFAVVVPYWIHTVLTDNGPHFLDPTGDGGTPEDIRKLRVQKPPFRCHAFEAAYADLDIEHCLTKPRHPWIYCRIDRMNRTIGVATVNRYHYKIYGQLRQHLANSVIAYNFAHHLKISRGLRPNEFTCKA